MFKEDEDTIKWVAERFGIPEEDVLWYHSGICYDRVGVRTKASADKVTAIACKESANGGWYDGMPLGGQHLIKDHDGVHYDITC